MKLFCLPYAGGSESIYYQWKKYLFNYNIQVIPIELKGRGRRCYENTYEDFEEAVDDIYTKIEKELDDDDYAIFGHSMGCLLAYELYYKIIKSNHNLPVHMFFSAHRVPYAKNKSEIIHKLPDEKFIQKVINLGGTPKEIMQSNELLRLIIPILRGDFRILEKYVPNEHVSKIQCKVSVLNGIYDNDISKEDILRWQDLCEKTVIFYNFEGNHFFINDKLKDVITAIISSVSHELKMDIG